MAVLRPPGVPVSIALALAAVAGMSSAAGAAVVSVRAKVETRPVPHAGDAADDVAIWVSSRRPSRSTIIGTDKQGGIGVYGLDGRQVQFRRDGRINNVDLRRGFGLGGRRVTLVTASNRTNDSIVVYRIVPRTRKLARVRARIRVGMDVYGLCMYRGPRTGPFYVFVTSQSGEVQQWRLSGRGREVSARRVRSFDVGSQAEGCVADDRLRRLYVAEESRGIWRYRAGPAGGERRKLVDRTGRGRLAADVEGLAIAKRGRRGYLVASSQGNHTFVLYRRKSNVFVKRFRIVAGKRIDAVHDTDGIDVTTASLGRRFRRGVFVAQDGNNGRPPNQNFKLVSWRAIARR
jgi:3-phytase